MPGPQDPTDRQTPPTAPPAALPRRSWLAIASATMGSVALLTSCAGLGISGILAAFLGMVALDRIRREEPMLRGRGLAWAGIGLGLSAFVLSLLVAWGFATLQQEWHGDLERSLQRTFAARDDAGATEAFSGWTGREGTTITAAEIAAFAREAESRYGKFIGFKELSEERAGGFRSVQRMIVTANFEFERGERLGSMGFCFITGTSSLLPELRIDSISILDAERGNLLIPAGTTKKTDEASGAETATSSVPASNAADEASEVRP
ncbi:MAG: DUF4190 domain-containing protein [Planctomycetaceae bacterium]|nr:DUF4190 domain-containing protein [Planctomycetaceae bacterium]